MFAHNSISMDKGNFIVIDGIDGSGKSTVLEFWISELEQKGKKIFSLKEYWKKHHYHPTMEELAEYDVIVSAEPTYVWTGAAIRYEMIKNGNSYSPAALAHSYALDRLVLYKRLLVPLREQGKIILQDRSVSTSLCYQSIQEHGLTMQQIAEIEGNAFTLEHAPDHLILVHLPIEKAMQRLQGRIDKDDNAIFEKEKFLTDAQARFLSEEYQQYFTSRGTHVHLLNSDRTLEDMKPQALGLLREFLL
jgi:dTMP kinase